MRRALSVSGKHSLGGFGPVANALTSKRLAPASHRLTTHFRNSRVPHSVGRRTYFASQLIRAQAAAAPASSQPDMFCFQCEQTREQKGCTTIGVCGKTPEVAWLQDLLIHATKGVSIYAHRARELAGLSDKEIDNFVLRALFSTLTNVSVSPTSSLLLNQQHTPS